MTNKTIRDYINLIESIQQDAAAVSQMYKMGWNDGVDDEHNDDLRSQALAGSREEKIAYNEYLKGFKDGLDHAIGPKGRGRSNPRRYNLGEEQVEESTPDAIAKIEQLTRK